MSDDKRNGWETDRKFVNDTLARLSTAIEKLHQKQSDDNVELIRAINTAKEDTLDRVGQLISVLEKRVVDCEKEVLMFKTKAAMLGGMAGFIMTLSGWIVQWVTR